MDVVQTQNGIQRIICAKVGDILCISVDMKQMQLCNCILLLKQTDKQQFNSNKKSTTNKYVIKVFDSAWFMFPAHMGMFFKLKVNLLINSTHI